MDIIKRIGSVAVLSFLFGFSFAETKVPLEVQRLHAKNQTDTTQAKPLPTFNPTIQQEPFVAMQIKPSVTTTAPSEKLGTPAPTAVYVIYPGSLKTNVTHLANEFGWRQVIWNAKFDYQWTGTTRITANNLNEILTKILKRYPLQAVFYQGNHILAIEPRNFT